MVKQNRAYVVGGRRPRAAKGKPTPPYPDSQRAFWANVHRAHSGRRGIVNSAEAFENIQRFLFGDTMVELDLDDIEFPADTAGTDRFFDIEFLLSIRGTGLYLHRREQDPCENAIRIGGPDQDLPTTLHLHTGFMNTDLRLGGGGAFSHFAMTLRVIERRVKRGFLWDHEYPTRPIFNETVEIRVGDFDADGHADVEHRWLSDNSDDWEICGFDAGRFRVPLRSAGAFGGTLALRARPWPDPKLTQDEA